MSAKNTPHFADPKGSIEEIPGIGITRAYGTAVPADGSKGYAPGCLYQKVNGGIGTSLYVNEGTALAADFNAK